MPKFPSRLLFKTIVPCPYKAAAPGLSGDISGWEGIAALPHLSELEGQPPIGEIKIAWNEAGVYLALRVKRTRPVVCNRRRPQSGDGLQVIIDTRAIQDVHRATRFCHQFVLLPSGGGPQGDAPQAWQTAISGAREESTLCRPQDIHLAASADVSQGFYTLEAAFPAQILTGFEPVAGHRIGFQYWLHDTERGEETYSAPVDLGAMQDPALWGLLELAR